MRSSSSEIAPFKIEPAQMGLAIDEFKTTLQAVLTSAAAHGIAYTEHGQPRLPAQFNEALNSIVPKGTRKLLDATLHMFREHDPYAIVDMHNTVPVLHKLESMMGLAGRHSDYANLFQTHTMRGLLDRQLGEFVGFYALRTSTGAMCSKLDIFATPKSLDGTAYPLRLFVDACNQVNGDPVCNGLMEVDFSPNVTPHLLASRAMSRIFAGVKVTSLTADPQTGTPRVSVPTKHIIDTHAVIPADLAPEVYMDELYTRLNLRNVSVMHRDMQFTSTLVHTTIDNGWQTYNALWFGEKDQTPASARSAACDDDEKEGSVVAAMNDDGAPATEGWTVVETELTNQSSRKKNRKTTLTSKATSSALASWDRAPKHVHMHSARLMTSLVHRRWGDTQTSSIAPPGAASTREHFEKRVLDPTTFRLVSFPYGVAELLAHGADNVPVDDPQMSSMKQIPHYGESDYERARPLLTTMSPVPIPLFGEYNGVWFMLDGGHRIASAAVRRSSLQVGVVNMSLVKSAVSTAVHPKLDGLILTRRELSPNTELYEVLSNGYSSRILPSAFSEKRDEFKNLSLNHTYFDRDDSVGSKLLRLPDVRRSNRAAGKTGPLPSVTRVMDRDYVYLGDGKMEGVASVASRSDTAATTNSASASSTVDSTVVPGSTVVPSTATDSTTAPDQKEGLAPPSIIESVAVAPPSIVRPIPPGQSGEAAADILAPANVSWEYLRNHAPVVHGVLGREWTNDNMPFQVNYGEQQVFTIGDLPGFDILHEAGKKRYMDYLERIPWGEMIAEVNGNSYDAGVELGGWGVDPLTGRPEAMSLVNDKRVLDALAEMPGAMRIVSPGTAEDDKNNPAVAGVFVRVPELKLNGMTLKSKAGFWFREEKNESGGGGKRKTVTLGNNVLKELRSIYVSDKGLSFYKNLIEPLPKEDPSCVMCGNMHANAIVAGDLFTGASSW